MLAGVATDEDVEVAFGRGLALQRTGPACDDPGVRWGITLTAWVVALAVPVAAHAQVYKYVKPDGTVLYTDTLAKLPPERRAYYNKLMEEQRRAAEKVESQAKQERNAQADAEAERRRLQNAQGQADLQRRLAALDAEIQRLREKNQAREAEKQVWRQRYLETKKALDDKLGQFRKLQEEYQGLAIQVDYAMFPGQRQRKNELQGKLEALEKEIDQLIHQLNVVLPEQARKAGVPPGWIR